MRVLLMLTDCGLLWLMEMANNAIASDRMRQMESRHRKLQELVGDDKASVCWTPTTPRVAEALTVVCCFPDPVLKS